MRSRLSQLLFAAVLALVSGLCAAKEPFRPLAKPLVLPAFNLVDQHGEAFDLARLKGRWTLMFAGFTTCPDVCPMTLTNLRAVYAELAKSLPAEALPQVLFVAVDPARDRAGIAPYMAYFHPDFIGVTGEVEQIDALIKGMDAFYRIDKKGPDDTHYKVVHTATVALANPDAKVVASADPPFATQAAARQLLALIDAGGAAAAKSADLLVEAAWSPPAPPGAMMAAGYFRLRNNSARARTLVAVSSAAYGEVSLHRTEIENGVAQMRELDEVSVAPGEVVELRPGAMHLMLMAPTHTAGVGEHIPLTLHFANGEQISAQMVVRPRDGGGDESAHAGHH